MGGRVDGAFRRLLSLAGGDGKEEEQDEGEAFNFHFFPSVQSNESVQQPKQSVFDLLPVSIKVYRSYP
jgi:hypothetical protein